MATKQSPPSSRGQQLTGKGPELRRQRRLVSILLTGLAISGLLFLLAASLPPSAGRYHARPAVVALVFCGLCYGLIRAGYTRIATYVFIVFLTLIAFVGAVAMGWDTGTVSAPLYFLSINLLVAAMFFGPRTIVGFAGLNTVLIGVIALVARSLFSAPLIVFLPPAALTWLLALVAWLYGRDLSAAQRDSELQAANLALANERLQQANEELQVVNEDLTITTDELLRANAELSALNAIAATVSQSLDLDEVLQQALESVSPLVEYEIKGIWLLEEDASQFVLAAHQGISEEVYPHLTRWPLSSSPDSPVARGQALVIVNPSPTIPEAAAVAQVVDLRTLVVIPLLARDKVLGVMTFMSTQEAPPAAQTQRVLESAGRQIGVAIENARLYNEVRRYSESLEEQVRQRTEEVRAAKEFSESIIQNAPIGITTWARDGTITSDNRAMIEIMGAEGSGVGLNALQFPTFERAGIRSYFMEALETGQPFKLDGVPYTSFAGGKASLLSWNVVPLKDESGLVEQLLILVEDVTERKRVEEEAKRRNEELAALNAIGAAVNHSLDLDEVLYTAVDVAVHSLLVDKGCVHLLSENGETLTLSAHRGLSEECLETLRLIRVGDGYVGRAVQAGKPIVVKDVGADGRSPMQREGIRSLVCLPLPAKNKMVGVLTLGSTTEKQFAPETMGLLAAIANQIGMAIENARLFADSYRRLHEMEDLYQASQVVASSLDIRDVLDKVVSLISRVANTPYASVVLVGENGQLTTSAQTFHDTAPLHIRARPNGVTRQIIATGRPLVFDEVHDDGTHNPSLIAAGIKSYAGVPIMAKGKALGVLFVHSPTPRSLEERIPLLTVFANHVAVAIENAQLFERLRRQMEELKHTQAQLIQAEKLSAIGRLVAGVAHELNNPLTAVIGYAELLQRGDFDTGTTQDLQRISSEAKRCTKIVRNLLTFAREHELERKYADINDILRSTLDLMAYQLKVDDVRVTTDLERRLPWTMIDTYQVKQVFLNLINNAHQAMVEAHGGGHLIVRTTLIKKGSEAAREAYEQGLALPLIRIEFTDDGPGIPADILPRVFDPFFTTKEVGQGTGLGLSICYGIVHEHGGRIYASSKVGHGSTFVVELPVLDATDLPTPISRSGATEETGQAHILVVDDEKFVTDLVARVLRAEGHRVDTVLDGQHALEELFKHDYDLLITDLKMPGLDGQELYEHLKVIRPDVARRMIFITGDTASEDTRAFFEETETHHVDKPFNPTELRRVVRQVLAGARADSGAPPA